MKMTYKRLSIWLFCQVLSLIEARSRINEESSQIDSQSLKCGQSALTDRSLNYQRIVGGQAVQKGMFPWQVGLRTCLHSSSSCDIKCGGSIITKKYLVTAAHCLGFFSLDIVAGMKNQYDFNEDHLQTYQSDRLLPHPMYNAQGNILDDYDIGLVRVKGEGFIFNDYVQPICLTRNDDFLFQELSDGIDDFDNQGERNFYVSGYGSTRDQGPVSDDLLYVDVKLIKTEQCEKWMRIEQNIPLSDPSKTQISDRMVCAGHATGEKDGCAGDSGGPLSVKSEEGSWVLFGAVSWGIGCAKARVPGVYARVSKFMDWILDETDLVEDTTDFGAVADNESVATEVESVATEVESVATAVESVTTVLESVDSDLESVPSIESEETVFEEESESMPQEFAWQQKLFNEHHQIALSVGSSNATAERCWTIEGNQVAPNKKIALKPCDTTNQAQKFKLSPSGQIHPFTATNICILGHHKKVSLEKSRDLVLKTIKCNHKKTNKYVTQFIYENGLIVDKIKNGRSIVVKHPFTYVHVGKKVFSNFGYIQQISHVGDEL